MIGLTALRRIEPRVLDFVIRLRDTRNMVHNGESKRRIYVIAGPNGAGKTTFAREFLPHYADCKQFINADLIAQGMSPFSPDTAAFRRGG